MKLARAARRLQRAEEEVGEPDELAALREQIVELIKDTEAMRPQLRIAFLAWLRWGATTLSAVALIAGALMLVGGHHWGWFTLEPPAQSSPSPSPQPPADDPSGSPGG